MAEVLIDKLVRQGRTLCLAESCTGGRASHIICQQPGASRAFLGSVVSYDNRVKQDLLGVDHNLIESHGAVSAEVALAMAEGALQATGADYVASFTGIAGPGGGSPDKPVGTLYIAWGQTEHLQIHGFFIKRGRVSFQNLAAYLGLDLLRRLITPIQTPPPYFSELSLSTASTIASRSPD